MQVAERTNAMWHVAGNIGLRPHMKYPRLRRGIFMLDKIRKAAKKMCQWGVLTLSVVQLVAFLIQGGKEGSSVR